MSDHPTPTRRQFCALLKSFSLLTRALENATRAQRNELAWRKSHGELATRKDLEKWIKKILMTQKQLSTALDELTLKTGKIAQEQSDRFDVLTKTIADLTAVIEAGDVTAEVTTALAATQAALESLDAAIPDAPAPE